MQYLLDEDLNPSVAEILRGWKIDAQSVHEIGRRGFSDDEQLRFAAAESRIFLTRNRDDFIKLTVSFFHSATPHAGVLIVPRGLPNDAPRRIAAALRRWHERSLQMHPYCIDFLSH